MQAYRVVGRFPNGRAIQPFTSDIVADSEDDARHRVLSSMGSRHRVSRRFIKIESISEIDPTDSAAAAVIAHFRAKEVPSPVATAPADASSEEE
jgi:large subunit ribosomal protein LX